MHKPVSLLFAGLLAGSCALAPALLRAQTPTPTPTPLQQRSAIVIAPPDAAVRAAFDAAGRGDLDDLQLAAFKSHPLAGWLEYAALRSRIDTLPLTRGNAFLSTNANTPEVARFRRDWLGALARRNEWQAFLANWDAGIEDATLRCLQLQALMTMNRVDATWTAAAQALWRSSGQSLPAQCDAPFALLAAQGGLTDTLRWERIDLAIAEGQPGVIRAAARALPAGDAKLAGDYAAYFDKPVAIIPDSWPRNARSREVASRALAKMAKASPDATEAMLPSVTLALGFNEAERGRVLAQIALWTVASYLPESARRLAAVPDAAFDASLHEWQVREALSRSDWAAALAAIRRMPESQRNDARWLYFAARTSELSGDRKGAQALYAQAATSSDFHGFLAADRLDQPYALCPLALQASNADKQAVAGNPALRRAISLYRLDRRGWATLEWNAALTGFSPTQRQLAVEIAQDNGWFDRGVFGLRNVAGKTYPDEQRLYALRFPLHHADSIRREAARNGLDPAWIAAEIRAESVFDPSARSSADARGLMQIQPATGAAVATKLGQPWGGGDSLYDADTSIVLGSAYLRQLMDRYGGKPYQVIAGYNAGPTPLNRWLTQRPTMDPDFWIETISYKETRDYVARVLAFSTLYDWRLDGRAHRISDRLQGRIDGPRKGFTCPVATAVAATATPTAPSKPTRARPPRVQRPHH